MARWLQASGRMSAAEHFEAVTGHCLDDFSRPLPRAHSAGRTWVPRQRRVSRRRYVATAMVLAAFIAVGLPGMRSMLAPNPFAVQGTGVSGYAWEEVGLRVRGSDRVPTTEPRATFHEAMERARASRQSFLGVMVHYDQEVLGQAHALMVQAIASSDKGYAVPPQAFDALREMEEILRLQNPDETSLPER